MARERKNPDPTKNEEFGAAGQETGIEQPSETGSAGLYATPIHDEAEKAEEAGRRTAESTSR
jgi:hypothetical protein